jgi:hypothetical protein
MVVHACNPSTWETKMGGHHDFESSLGFIGNYDTSLIYLVRLGLKKPTKQNKNK